MNRAAILAFLTWTGLSMRLENPGQPQILLNLIASFQGFDLARLLLLPGLYLLFRKSSEEGFRGKRWTRLAPAVFFAMNMVLGYAADNAGGGNLLLSLHDGQLIKAAAVGACWSIVFYHLLTVLYAQLDTVLSEEKMISRTPYSLPGSLRPLRRYEMLLQKHPFRTAFLTLLILYLPHMLIAYPAMFMGDTWSMIVQGYPELGTTGVSYLPAEQVIREGVYINQHHPVLYTLLLHLCLQTGDALFHSLNKGIFLLCLGQAVVILAAFSYVISSLSARNVRPKFLILIMLYVLLHPQIRNHLFMATKDGLYSACFMALMTSFFRLRIGERRKKDWLILSLAAAGLVLFRNEGKYVLLGSGVLIFLVDRKSRKAVFCFFAAVLVFALSIFQGLYPMLGYSKGGFQEVLSVPLQQTARIVKEHPDDISGPERAAIEAVTEFSQLADAYVPSSADTVKSLYRTEATGRDIFTWIKVWIKLTLRHPVTALKATYANYYQLLYPGNYYMNYDSYGWSAWMCEFTNNCISDLGKAFSLPDWNKRYRFIFDSMLDAGLLNLPPFSLMMAPSLYIWTLLAMLCWIFGRKKDVLRPRQLALMMPSLLTLLVQFAGPTNGFYGRYLLPLTSFLPFLLLMLLFQESVCVPK